MPHHPDFIESLVQYAFEFGGDCVGLWEIARGLLAHACV